MKFSPMGAGCEIGQIVLLVKISSCTEEILHVCVPPPPPSQQMLMRRIH